jgi:FkbM family methyltransferase
MISYAQNFEDVILRRVFKDQRDGFYIDVGAMDPIVDSVTKFFYDEGWSGINIEPNEWFYDKLTKERPRDINLNLALGDHDEIKRFYLFEQYGNSTFEEASRDRFIARGFEATETTVRVTTLSAICRDYVTRPINFLKIDCEGWEKAAIQGADWDQFRPTILVIEATLPETAVPSWSEWEPFLIEKAGYDMVYFDGLNRFYVRRESADLRYHFKVPPNLFDEFKTYSTVVAEEQRDALLAERDALIRAAEEKREALRGERDALVRAAEQDAVVRVNDERRIEELQISIEHVGRLNDEIVALKARAGELDRLLRDAKLWVGRLSQELAASKRG